MRASSVSLSFSGSPRPARSFSSNRRSDVIWTNPYDHLSISQRSTVNAQGQAAVAAVPGSTLDAYELPHRPSSAAQVLVDRGAQQFRVYIHPQILLVLKLDNEDHCLENVVSKPHGELFIGDVGSWIVELAASWAVIMILTGLFLWWPWNAKGLAASFIRACVRASAHSGGTFMLSLGFTSPSSRHASIRRLASVSVPNRWAFKHSARKVPWNDSTKALSVGLPGREKSIFIPF
jgi:hypothetical protein